MKKNQIEKNFNNGVLQLSNRLYKKAIASFSECISLGQKVPEVYSNRGIAYYEAGLYVESIEDYRKAIQLNSNYVEAYCNLGVTLNQLKRFKDASIELKKAISLRPTFPTAYINLGISFQNLSLFDEALRQYDFALQLNPNNEIAHMQRGITFLSLKKYIEAFDSFDKAISLKPDYIEAYLNAGVTFMVVRNPKEALAIFNQAIQIDPKIARLHKLKSNVLNELQQYEASMESLSEALKIDVNIDWGLGDLLHRKNMRCNWQDYDESLSQLEDKIKKNLLVTSSFIGLSVFDKPDLLKKIATLDTSVYPQIDPLQKNAHHKKIRLGFYSSDFHNHPITHLTTEFFETINRSRFEVTAFYFGPAKNQDPYKARLIKVFDRFIDAIELNSLDVLRRSRELEIDIAIDLSGLTNEARTEIFALRVAPIQLQWLGFLGTMGAEFIDYIFADKILIPEEERAHYSEKIVYLPHYQPNNNNREISTREFIRSDFGLSDDQFVFCCFNGAYKISPHIFNIWMNILKGSPKSVLWIAEENETAKLNIKNEALARGVEPSRIVFANKIPLPGYMARFRFADIFLDTYPYSAGTVASDALRMGLPLIALQGRTFSSRMSSSLLHSINMPELVTKSSAQYEALAIDLYNDHGKYDMVKRKMQSELLKSPLFDIESTTKSIEMAFEIIYERSQSNKPIEHIFLDG
jgi:predicted O-linked N-acetylglucosamine transferase (SPINDLY family)